MLVYLNGQFVAAEQARIPVWDGGYLYGDGVYTTLRLYRGRPLDLAAHLERLRRHAAALALPVPLADADAGALVERLAVGNGLGARDGRLRITVSRGGDPHDPLPLRDLERLQPTVLMTLAPVPAELAAWARDGIAVCLLPPGSGRGNLPHLKTLNGLPALLAQRQAARLGCREAILLSDDGHLLEGAVSNLFLVLGGRLATPAGDENLLPGRTRERILQLAAGLGVTCERRRLTPGDLEAADEAFTASSVREILPITRVVGPVTVEGDSSGTGPCPERPLGSGLPGPLTRRLQSAYRDLVEAALAADGAG